MSNDYTPRKEDEAFALPPVPDHPESCVSDYWSPYELSAISAYGHAVAAPLLARIAELENQLGITRMCVMCGKYKPAAEPRESPGCPPVDPEYGHLCGFDMTPQEAWAHWRQRAHDRRIESDRLRAELEAITTANAALRAALTECADDLEAEVNARASAGELPRRIERDLEPVRKARALLAQPAGPWVNPLAAELEKLLADAERWKWRKENPTARLVYAGGFWRVESHLTMAWHDSADAAVDAAIAARKGEGV